MKNFKQIAEDCLAGKLSGTFVIDKGKNWHSSYLQRHTVLGREMPGQYVLGPGIIYNEIGQCEGRERVRIIDFIPDNKNVIAVFPTVHGYHLITHPFDAINLTTTYKDVEIKKEGLTLLYAYVQD